MIKVAWLSLKTVSNDNISVPAAAVSKGMF